MKLCKAKIEDTRDSRLVRYCVLKIGHAGNHSLEPRDTCQYPAPNGSTLCGLPISHPGQHKNGLQFGGKGW